MDNEILGEVMRVLKGVEVTEETLAVDVTAEVGPGGNFLQEDHTFEHMRQEHFVPKIADRQPRENWEKAGKKDTFTRCHEIVLEALETHKPKAVDEEMVKAIRAKFPNFVQ
jgi:trimethylamine--corrinoid protein Co-methyltransferase